MSELRQRKSTTSKNVNKQDSPQSDASWEKDLDANGRKTNDDINDDEGNSLIKQQPTLEPPTSIPPPIPSKLDKLLSTYGSFSGSTFTADQGIKILQWSSWAIAYTTSKSKQYPNLAPALQDISFEFSFARYILRFFGFFQSLEGYRSGSWAGGSWDNPQIAKIAKYLLCGSMMAYYPLEHLAYAGWKVPKLVKVNANKMSAISCVFWTTYIVGDFWASHLKWKELKCKLSKIEEVLTGKKRDDIDKEHVVRLSNCVYVYHLICMYIFIL